MHRVTLKSQQQPEQQSASTLGSRNRGRPKLNRKPKVPHIITATGKGRGRPKNQTKINEDLDFDHSDGQSDECNEKTLAKKDTPVHRAKPRGRPRKVVNSDDDDDGNSDSDNEDNDEERRSVGRPPTGAINLNIVRTGRKPGRPKKKGILAKRAAALADGVSKKRGRPSSGIGPYIPTGKPRGRPKLAENINDTPLADISHKNDDEEKDAVCALSSIDGEDDDHFPLHFSPISAISSST